MSWFRLPRWLRRRRPDAAPAGVGRETSAKTPYVPFDTLIEDFREQVGEAQARVNARLESKLRRQLTLLDSGEVSREDLFFHLPPDGRRSPAIDLPIASFLYQRVPAISEVSVTMDAAVIRKPGPEPGYALVFGDDAARVARRKLRVSIKMTGTQPGDTEILIDGASLKTLDAGDTGSAKDRGP